VQKQLQAQLSQASARLAEANKALEAERGDKKRASDDLSAKVHRAEQRIAQLSAEAQGKSNDFENKLKEMQTQLSTRARKNQELELAVENAHAAKVRSEKELAARVAASEA